jgi:hypothetical protein
MIIWQNPGAGTEERSELSKTYPGIRSYRDAQGFRINDRKLKVKLIDAYIYHYGWVKPPKGLTGQSAKLQPVLPNRRMD